MRFILLLFFICSFVLNTYSQPQYSVGGKIGVGIGNMASDYTSGSTGSRTGLTLGMVGSMSLGKQGNLFAVGELLFNQKGGKDNLSGSNFNSYLELPILGRYTFTVSESIPLKIFLNAGPYFGILLSRKVEPFADMQNTLPKSNPLEMGVAGGGGIMYPMGAGTFFLEVRYATALTSVVPSTLERNQQTTISVGYLIPLSGKTEEQKDKTIDSGFEEKTKEDPKMDTAPKKERKRDIKKPKGDPAGKKASEGSERRGIPRRSAE